MFFKHKKRYTVYTYGAEILKQPAGFIDNVDDELRETAAEMLETLKVFNGIGLAGPQAGINKRIVVLDIPAEYASKAATPGEVMLLPRMPLVVINPEIVRYSEEKDIADEGCLSVPELFGPVERPVFVQFRALTIDGELIECECGGLLARCLQHELDHLDGVLYVDRMVPEEFSRLEPKLKRLLKSGRKNDFKKSIMK
ncbi:peptide deformylase [Lentisphaerota bacterium ZTH]|nr:peptide deformylase [Lentisphaerota bacterium]WET06502.1 peptide deformylase [Lentisphaerota bacterium ZTH]